MISPIQFLSDADQWLLDSSLISDHQQNWGMNKAPREGLGNALPMTAERTDTKYF